MSSNVCHLKGPFLYFLSVTLTNHLAWPVFSIQHLQKHICQGHHNKNVPCALVQRVLVEHQQSDPLKWGTVFSLF